MNIYRSFISAATPFIAIRRRALPPSPLRSWTKADRDRSTDLARVPHSSVPEVPWCTLHRNRSRNSRPTMDRVEFTCGWDRGLFLGRYHPRVTLSRWVFLESSFPWEFFNFLEIFSNFLNFLKFLVWGCEWFLENLNFLDLFPRIFVPNYEWFLKGSLVF